MIQMIDGGVTAPKGFLAAGRHIGIKKIKKDLSLLVSETPAVTAGMFTKSLVRAAPVVRNEALLQKKQKMRGLVTISGNANACTGEQGLWDNEEMAAIFAGCIGAETEEVLTAATGIIGLKMPMDIVRRGIPETAGGLSKKREAARDAAGGIITTDTFLKEIAVTLPLGGKLVRIGAMAKGSGMVHPDMATVLCFITTDLCISEELLKKALFEAVDATYHMISVDGATSTNDMVLILANGQAENEELTEECEDYREFVKALTYINEKLAKDVVHDGEGSVKFIEVRIQGAKSREDARKLAKSVITNDLVKTAMYGEDANWGRVLAAMGSADAYFRPEHVTMYFESVGGSMLLMEDGQPIAFDENTAAEILRKEDILIQVQLADGASRATAWGCDLGHEYIRINGEYRSRN